MNLYTPFYKETGKTCLYYRLHLKKVSRFLDLKRRVNCVLFCLTRVRLRPLSLRHHLQTINIVRSKGRRKQTIICGVGVGRLCVYRKEDLLR